MTTTGIIYTSLGVTFAGIGVTVALLAFRRRKNFGFVALAVFWPLVGFIEARDGQNVAPPSIHFSSVEAGGMFISQTALAIPMPLLSMGLLAVTIVFYLNEKNEE